MTARRFACSECGLKYGTKVKLTEHAKVHKVPTRLKNKQFTCKICSKVFTSAVLQKKHQNACNKIIPEKNGKDKLQEKNKQVVGSSSIMKRKENTQSIKEMFSKMQTLLELPKSPTKASKLSDIENSQVSIRNMSMLIKNSLKPVNTKQNDTLASKLNSQRTGTRGRKPNSAKGNKTNNQLLNSLKVTKSNLRKQKSVSINMHQDENMLNNIEDSTESLNEIGKSTNGSRQTIKKNIKSSGISLKRYEKKKVVREDTPDVEDIIDESIEATVSPKKSEIAGKKMVNGNVKKQFTCAQCKKNFSRKYHLDRHLKLSPCSGLPPQAFPCHVCNRVYSRKDNLREHLRQHTGEAQRVKRHKCSHCNKAFHGQSLLTIHLRTHTGEKPFPCDFCTKSFPSLGALSKHRRTHTGEKPFECSDCGHRFSLKGTLKRHLRVHTGVRPHKCMYCGKEFIQIGGLKAHMFYHTGQGGFKCDECDKVFNRKARLQMHKLYVHVKLRPFVCDHCPKTFTRKEDLNRHAVLHTGEKPFKCPTCNKTFAIKPSLKLHLLTHTKEEPRSCHECGRAFIRKDCLLRHMRKRHRDLLDKILLDEKDEKLGDSSIVSSRMLGEEDLCENITELLSLLVEESTLVGFGWPNKPVDEVLEAVIRRCGHTPVSPHSDQYSFMDRMRENAKLLFTVVIDDNAVKTLLNNQTVDEVILHVLRLAKT